MKLDEIMVNIKPIIADCIGPGAVLLSASAVQALWDFHGISPADLESCGAIFAKEPA